MNLNKESPQSKSEKAAIKALIELSQVENSPVLPSSLEIEKWIHRNRNRETNENPQLLPLIQTKKNSSYFNQNYVSTQQEITTRRYSNTTRKISLCNLVKKKCEIRKILMPAISLQIPENKSIQFITNNLFHQRSIPKPVFQNKSNPRSISYKYVKTEDEKETTTEKKELDIPKITKAIQLLIKKQKLKNKPAKDVSQENKASEFRIIEFKFPQRF